MGPGVEYVNATAIMDLQYFESHLYIWDGIRNEKDETIVPVFVLEVSVGCRTPGWAFVNLMVFTLTTTTNEKLALSEDIAWTLLIGVNRHTSLQAPTIPDNRWVTKGFLSNDH